MSIDMKATTFVFPHETLTPVTGKPTHESVTLLRKEVYANAFQNECTLGGGDNGYLGIIMPTEKYKQAQINAGITEADTFEFTKPAAPDPLAASATILRTNKDILDYKAMEGHLKRQILTAIDREYIEALDDDSIGFARITAKALLEYIVTKYDVITYAELKTNRDRLDEAWDSSEPIHRLWSRTLQVQRFAEAGHKPIDDETAMHTLLTVLQKTGVFTIHITIWKQKPVNTWTMKAFQDFFDEADKERNLHTSKEAGYANTAKTGGKKVIANANAASTTNTSSPSYMVFGDKKIYYCWSHGGNVFANHTSQTCNRQRQGHVKISTWDNTCGGCTDILISESNKQHRRDNNRNNRNNNGSNHSNNNGNSNGSNNGNSNKGNGNGNNTQNDGNSNNSNQSGNSNNHNNDDN